MTNEDAFSQLINRQIMIAWVAGLFEGEGTFCFHKERPKTVQITSTDLDVLEKVKENFGGKIYMDVRYR